MATNRREKQGESPRRTRPFWEDPEGLDVYTARLLPGGRVLYLGLRLGQSYQIELAALGFSGPGGMAAPDPTGRGVVLILGSGESIDLSSRLLLSIADPAYREAAARADAEPKPVGARIRARRRAARKSARELAVACGMAPSNWARLEASRHSPRLATLERVAAVLGLEVAELLEDPEPG